MTWMPRCSSSVSTIASRSATQRATWSRVFGCIGVMSPVNSITNVVLDRVFLDEAVDRLHAGVERGVDADERLPLLGQRVLGEDRLDRALVDARPVLDVDARLCDDVRHAGHTLARWLRLPAPLLDGRQQAADQFL